MKIRVFYCTSSLSAHYLAHIEFGITGGCLTCLLVIDMCPCLWILTLILTLTSELHISTSYPGHFASGQRKWPWHRPVTWPQNLQYLGCSIMVIYAYKYVYRIIIYIVISGGARPQNLGGAAFEGQTHILGGKIEFLKRYCYLPMPLSQDFCLPPPRRFAPLSKGGDIPRNTASGGRIS
jgi:hypothetical protein